MWVQIRLPWRRGAVAERAQESSLESGWEPRGASRDRAFTCIACIGIARLRVVNKPKVVVSVVSVGNFPTFSDRVPRSLKSELTD